MLKGGESEERGRKEEDEADREVSAVAVTRGGRRILGIPQGTQGSHKGRWLDLCHDRLETSSARIHIDWCLSLEPRDAPASGAEDVATEWST